MKPKHCPCCGKKTLTYMGYWVNSDWIETKEKLFFGIAYDCICKACNWSGDIESDEDSEIKHGEEIDA